MEVILLEDVENLGRMGDIVKVADGYARNYLIPRKLAVKADPKRVKEFEHKKRMVQRKVEKKKKALQSVAEKLKGVKLVFKRKLVEGEEGKIYGSVSAVDIVNALKDNGIELGKANIELDKPLKQLGIFTVPVKLELGMKSQVEVEIIGEDGG